MWETITRLWIQFDQRTLGSWCRCKWLPGSGCWLWLLAGCGLLVKCLEQNWKSTWPLITSCCFDRVCVFFICVFSWGPRSIVVSLYGSSPQVKRLVQSSLASALFSALSSFTVTHSWSGQNGSHRSGNYSRADVRWLCPSVMSPPVRPFVDTFRLHYLFLCWLFFD